MPAVSSRTGRHDRERYFFVCLSVCPSPLRACKTPIGRPLQKLFTFYCAIGVRTEQWRNTQPFGCMSAMNTYLFSYLSGRCTPVGEKCARDVTRGQSQYLTSSPIWVVHLSRRNGL